MKKKIIIIIISILAALTGIYFIYNSKQEAPSLKEDEIALDITLDLKEDIGLLLIGYNVNGIEGSGGVSNADKSLLKHNEHLYHTLSKQDFSNETNLDNLKLYFKVVTKYVDPNYEDIYPEEYTKVMKPLTINAKYGETYKITITGDNVNGYQAILN